VVSSIVFNQYVSQQLIFVLVVRLSVTWTLSMIFPMSRRQLRFLERAIAMTITGTYFDPLPEKSVPSQNQRIHG
jgi:hypothetical protein